MISSEMRPEPGYSWTDLDGDSGFVSADVELDEAEKETNIVAVLSVRNGKQEAGVYVTVRDARALSQWFAALASSRAQR